jgi:hypothetical protein
MRRTIIVGFAMLASTAAFAIDFQAPILNQDKKPAILCADEKAHTGCNALTLGSVSAAALFAELPSDHDQRTGGSFISPDQKVKNAALALRILDTKEDVKLSAEEIANIKARVGAAFPPLVVLRTWQLIDPSAK